MKKHLFAMTLVALIMILAACGDSNSPAKNGDNNNQVTQEVEANHDKVEQASSTTLPSGFPDDFPFPDDITITEVMDNSEGSQKDFTIRFTFDPDMELEPIFEMYDAYSEKIGYKSIVDSEEYFAEGIFQYGAMLPSSPNDIFIVTLQPTDKSYGSIDVKFQK